jgi:hypothetical protein
VKHEKDFEWERTGDKQSLSNRTPSLFRQRRGFFLLFLPRAVQTASCCCGDFSGQSTTFAAEKLFRRSSLVLNQRVLAAENSNTFSFS